MSNHSIYNPDFFIPHTLAEAKKIVLGYGRSETPNRWQIETDWIQQLFVKNKFITEKSVVLDWGCGLGRLSKMIIQNFNCKVIGVDLNQSMLNFAKDYVSSPLFSTYLYNDVSEIKCKFSNIISVWTLQHSFNIDKDLQTLNNFLDLNGQIFIFEDITPAIPIIDNGNGNWRLLPDGLYRTKSSNKFKIIQQGRFPYVDMIPENSTSWYSFYVKKSPN